MDFLERKNISLLQRLRQLQVEQCCLHIDQQIGLWYQNQLDPLVPPTISHDGDHHHHHHHHHNHNINPHHNHHHHLHPHPQNHQPQQQHQLSPPPPPPQLEQQPPEPIEEETIVCSLEPPSLNSTKQPDTSSDQKPLTVNSTSTQQQQQQPIIKKEIEETVSNTEATITTIPTTIAAEVTTTTTAPTETAVNVKIEPPTPIIETIITTTTTPEPTATLPQLTSPCMTVGASAIVEADDSITTSPITLPHLQDDEERTVGCFLSNLKHLESLDSDATDSTSSNDSYDELEGFSHEDIPPKNAFGSRTIDGNLAFSDLKKKAIWKWANDRSRLASRWTWLQAQVADLEFRIRGQNDATMHARAYKTPPLPPVLPENSCSRTVPISKDFRRRRLIKSSQILSDSNKKLVKFSHVPCICSSLPQTVAPCLSCNGRYNYLRQLEGENAPVSERISLLDHCCHPVLSFPDDLTLGSQFSYLLKQETINRKPVKGRPGRKKGSTAANLAAAAAAAAAANGDKNAKHQGKKGKYYHGMVGRPPGSQKNPSQTMITSNKLRRKYRKHSNTNNYDSNNWNGANNLGHTNNRRNKRIRRASSMNESSVCSESSNQYRPNHFSNNTAQNVTRRRRSEQSAYDIDNIVIPFSIAATTRVEILEYKEIMTPSWRVWENGTCPAEAVEEDVEDTSDEAYISRHSKGESEEKKRFSLKPPKTRVDSIQCIPSLN